MYIFSGTFLSSNLTDMVKIRISEFSSNFVCQIQTSSISKNETNSIEFPRRTILKELILSIALAAGAIFSRRVKTKLLTILVFDNE